MTRALEARLRRLETKLQPEGCTFFLAWGRTEEASERVSLARAAGEVGSGDVVMVARWTVTYTERMSPDTTACIFWLKNRKPEEWRDKTQVEPSWAGKKPSEMTNEELDAAWQALQPLLPPPGQGELRTPPRNRAGRPCTDPASRPQRCHL